MVTQYLISTDLDGTLLDHHDYSWRAAQPALTRCKELGVPVILNTSKTQAEVEELSLALDLNSPMIVENGSVMLIPSQLMAAEIPVLDQGPEISLGKRNLRLQFGVERGALLNFIKLVRADQKWQFEGFNDWSVDEIAARTGLDKKSAKAAGEKRYSEPFVWNDSDENLVKFQRRAELAGFKLMRGGRFYHLQGKTDKAKPLRWLRENAGLVMSNIDVNSSTVLICLGDNHNDIAMLNIADIPVCVKSPVSNYPELSTDRAVIRTDEFGPIGWNKTILKLLELTPTSLIQSRD